MRNKFLGTGEAGYHPLRKLQVIMSGLRFAVLHDFSVAYKLVLSVVILVVAFMLRQWVDFMMILTATGLVLMAELFNSAIEALVACAYHNISFSVLKPFLCYLISML